MSFRAQHDHAASLESCLGEGYFRPRGRCEATQSTLIDFVNQLPGFKAFDVRKTKQRTGRGPQRLGIRSVRGPLQQDNTRCPKSLRSAHYRPDVAGVLDRVKSNHERNALEKFIEITFRRLHERQHALARFRARDLSEQVVIDNAERHITMTAQPRFDLAPPAHCGNYRVNLEPTRQRFVKQT